MAAAAFAEFEKFYIKAESTYLEQPMQEKLHAPTRAAKAQEPFHRLSPLL
jgi:hypothetical protein